MLLRDTKDADAGFTLSLWDSKQAMSVHENSDTMKTQVLPAVEPFFIGEYNTIFVAVRYDETDG